MQDKEVFPQMKIFRSMRFLLLALLLSIVPASSYAGVFISVAVAPPVLPVYVQPDCPEPGWMWTPGYWAYGDDGYYWVPGTWVPAPYVGALWTPGYWGWGSGLYEWHPGYWGPHVGYYGGVNYGFGYMGVGFAGGLWVGGAFRYNTAVMHVNETVIHNTYRDETIVHNTTIMNNNRVAFSGGPGGINHVPTAQENAFSHEQHQGATSFQTQHQTAAFHNTAMFAKNNGGHPANAAVARPMGVNAGTHANIGSQSSGAGAGKVTMNSRVQGHSDVASPKPYNAQPHNNTTPMEHNAPLYHAQPQVHNNPPATHNNMPATHNNMPATHNPPPQHEGPPAHVGGVEPHSDGGHEHGR
jgi:WXXGXW repeat (2 copies)